MPPLEAVPLGAYTNIWNNEGAGAPAASVFANMDDETLSPAKKAMVNAPGIRLRSATTQMTPRCSGLRRKLEWDY